jgi:hypothetical protein
MEMIIATIFLLAFIALILIFGIKVLFNKLYFEKTLHYLATMFEEEKGVWSSTRFSMIFTVVFSNIVLWSLVIILSSKTLMLAAIPESLIVLYGIGNGVAFSGKIFQKKEEVKSENKPNETK